MKPVPLKLEKEHLKLSYRHSVMMEHPLVVLRAGFSFKKGDAAAISDRVTELSRLRREKQPLEYPSAGAHLNGRRAILPAS